MLKPSKNRHKRNEDVQREKKRLRSHILLIAGLQHKSRPNVEARLLSENYLCFIQILATSKQYESLRTCYAKLLRITVKQASMKRELTKILDLTGVVVKSKTEIENNLFLEVEASSKTALCLSSQKVSHRLGAPSLVPYNSKGSHCRIIGI